MNAYNNIKSSSFAAAMLLCATGASIATPTTFEQFLADQKVANRSQKSEAGQRRVDWWRDARFGMFIHWNPSSVVGCEISWSKQFYPDTGENLKPNPRPGPGLMGINEWSEPWLDWFHPPVPGEVYDNLYKSFYPGMYDADKIVALAKQAGMKYIVQIAKHADGFSMWPTAYSDYSIKNSPFKRDIIGEMAAACERAGMKFGVYYIQRDWHHPDYGPERMAKYNEYMRNQIKELLEKYKNISIMWFDSEGFPFDLWEGEKLFRLIHQLRPDIVINNRCGIPGDFSTPEQYVGLTNLDRDWESNMTFSGYWAWHGFQNKIIPYEEVLHRLIRCAGGGGNMLMNVSPMPTGEIDPREADRLKNVGQWLDVHGEAVYGTKGGPYQSDYHVASTRKGNTIYVHVMEFPDDGIVRLPKPGPNLVKSRLLSGGAVNAIQSQNGIEITVAPENRFKGATVIALEFDQPVMDIAMIEPPKPISLGKPVRASNQSPAKPGNEPSKVNDGNRQTRWIGDDNVRSGWIEIDLGAEVEINRVMASEVEWPTNTRAFELEVNEGGTWRVVAKGTTLGPEKYIGFAPVKASAVRLRILQTETTYVAINEFQVFAK